VSATSWSENETGMTTRHYSCLVPCTIALWMTACAGAEDADRHGDGASEDSSDDDDNDTLDPTADAETDDSVGESDGESGDGETDDGETSEGETDDGETSEGETDDGETSEGETGDGETGDTGNEDTGGSALPDDGDSLVDPAVLAQFRNTSPGPVAIDEPLFNEEAIDTRGVQYTGAIASDDDPSDHLRFSIVPGENDPYLRVTMECANPLVRAQILRDDEPIDAVLCGEGETMVLLDDASSLDVFDVVVYGEDDMLPVTDYVLSLDAFCFGGCNYQPYAP
jgi:hypothetical protein